MPGIWGPGRMLRWMLRREQYQGRETNTGRHFQSHCTQGERSKHTGKDGDVIMMNAGGSDVLPKEDLTSPRKLHLEQFYLGLQTRQPRFCFWPGTHVASTCQALERRGSPGRTVGRETGRQELCPKEELFHNAAFLQDVSVMDAEFANHPPFGTNK